MKLRTYMARRGLTDRDFAVMVDKTGKTFTRTTVSRMRREVWTPTTRHLMLIHKLTRGKVSLHDWPVKAERGAG